MRKNYTWSSERTKIVFIGLIIDVITTINKLYTWDKAQHLS